MIICDCSITNLEGRVAILRMIGVIGVRRIFGVG